MTSLSSSSRSPCIVTVVGARPQFVKAAVVSRAFAEAGLDECLIHTGQHYDAAMSDIFFEELGIAPPAHNLDPDQARHHLERIIEGLPELASHLETVADNHGKHLLDAHRRVRRADARRGVDRGLRSISVEAHRPDALGVFVLLPAQGGAA